MPLDTTKKFREQRSFAWTDDGHRLNLYINAYLNVSVRTDKAQEYLAAALETIAAELRKDAVRSRGQLLREQTEMMHKVDVPLDPSETREVIKEERLIEQQEKVATR